MLGQGGNRRPWRALLAVLVFGAVFANGLWWARAVRPNGAPDEAEHMDVVRFAFKNKRLPRYGDPNFTVSLMDTRGERVADPKNLQGIVSLSMYPRNVSLRQTYLFTAQLPYALNSYLCRFLSDSSYPNARSFDALCIAAAALCGFFAAWCLWPGRLVPALVTGGCIGAWPQVSFLAAYVNDDAFAVFVASLLFAVLAWCQSGPFDRRRAVGLGVALGLVANSKLNVMMLLPLVLVWFWRYSSATLDGVKRRFAPHFRRRVLLTVAIAVALAAPFYVRNMTLYGDPTGRRFLHRSMREFVDMLPADVQQNTNLLFLKREAFRPTLQQMGKPWFQHTFESFWARFGWMNVFAPHRLILLAYIVLIVSLVWSLRPQRSPERPPWWGVPYVVALPGLVLLVAASLANTYWIDPQPQGRYLLPAAPAIVLQSVTGLATMRSRRIAALLLILLLAFFVGENLYCRLYVLH